MYPLIDLTLAIMCLTSPIFDLTAHFLLGNTVYFLCKFRAIGSGPKPTVTTGAQIVRRRLREVRMMRERGENG